MRTRSDAMAITNNTKIRMSKDISAMGDPNNEANKEKITSYIQDRLKIERRLHKTIKSDNHITFPPPNYLDIKKEYSTKGEKPILFHDKAKIADNLDKTIIGEIEPYSQHVDFQTFLSQFTNEDELKQFEIFDLFNSDFEKIGELKDKVTHYSEITSNIINESNEEGNEDLLVFFCEKLNELKRNEINLEMFVNNIERVDGLCFSDNKVELHFKK